MSKIIGIDLGTSNSRVAVMQDGYPKTIKDKRGLASIPSVVGISPSGELIVGEEARNQRITSPENTVKSIKRKMGTAEKVTMAGKEYTPPEISAMILRHLKRLAEDYLGEKVEKAVITVPAYFSDSQRQATKDAGEIAGLEVVRIINEPTASALAYGVDKVQENQNILVYDLGGGTLDVSVIEKVGDVMEVRATHGNNYLGGDDFDKRLQDYVIEKLKEQHPGLEIEKDLRAVARIDRLVEDAKIQLSTNAFARMSTQFLTKKGLLSSVHLDMEISRQDFISLIQDLLESTTESIDVALKDAELTSDKMDKILLVGGSTKIPAVWDLVQKHMGKAPHADVDPYEAVALGAAVQAGIIAGEKINAVLVDVCPYTLGIEHVLIKGGKIIPGFYKSILKRNTTIPTSISEVFYTLYPDQDIVEIKVYQGDYGIASMNTPVGAFKFSNISPAKDKERPREVVVQFDYDVDGILHVSAIDRQTSRKEEGLVVSESQIKLSSEQKEKAKTTIAKLESSDKKEEIIEKWYRNTVAFHKKLEEQKKDQAVLKQISEFIANLEQAKQEGKCDERLINRISDLMYDYDFQPE